MAGVASRRTAEVLIAEGRVTVNGAVVTTLGAKAVPGRDEVKVDGRRIGAAQRARYILLNKPRGYVTTRRDPEGRRTVLDLLSEELRRFTLFTNVTLIQSEIDVGNEGLSSLTNPSRPMAGQSEYVVNAGLGYAADDGRLNATMLYNVAGRRLVEAGILPLPDTYEQERHLLDVSVQFPVTYGLSAKLDAKNLLDEPVEYLQGPVTRLRYQTGRIFNLGFKWELR